MADCEVTFNWNDPSSWTWFHTIGLPLPHRLAEYLRTRLKGTEAEIAMELEHKWDHIIFDWKSDSAISHDLRNSAGVS